MSILNVMIQPTRALVAVDTRWSAPSGASGETCKMRYLCHMNALLAGRGTYDLLGIAEGQCAFAGDFDAAADVLPAALPKFIEQIRTVRASIGLDSFADLIGGQEIVLVGWSARKGRMLGMNFVKAPGQPNFTSETIDDDWIIGPGGLPEDMPDPNSASRMQALAHKQMQIVRAKGLEAQFGGRLIVAELTRRGLTVVPRGDLEPMASHRNVGEGARTDLSPTGEMSQADASAFA